MNTEYLEIRAFLRSAEFRQWWLCLWSRGEASDRDGGRPSEGAASAEYAIAA
jgi:hypothetical protein